MAGHSFGVLCAAHKKIHCSVAVIWVQVDGKHWVCNLTAKPFNSIQNCLRIKWLLILIDHNFSSLYSPQMLIFPNTVVLPIGHCQNQLNIRWFFTNKLLNVLLHHQGAIHFLKRLILPTTKFLQCQQKYQDENKFFTSLHQAQDFSLSCF